jgi:peroxidase
MASNRIVLVLFLVAASLGAASAQLSPNFYSKSCPQLFSIVKSEIQKAVKAEKRMAASLVRLHFHDCFVLGCDGSLLLDDSPTIVSEKFALANNRSARGFEVIDSIKAALEKACPRTVSCADILAIAYHDSAVEVGLSQPYQVLFGRRDSLNANRTEANLRLPSPALNYSGLVANFKFQNLDERDLIALSGGHTIGRVRCGLVRLFLNDTDTNAEFRSSLNKACPANGDPFALQNLDIKTPDKFDNNYYKNLRRGEGIIRSDQTLWSTPGPNQAITKDFAENKESFFAQFAISSIKMGNIRVLTGNRGEIRRNCRVVNSPSGSVAYE